MARVSHIQASFTAGELSPRLYGRVDLAKYQTGLSLCRNMLLMPHGGVTRRPGTRFVAEVKDSSQKARLVPFEFSTVQTYMLELGNLYLRVYKDGGQVMNGASPVEVTTPYSTADLPGLKFAQNADTLFLVHPNYAPRSLTRTSHTAWTLSTMTFTDGPYLDENTEQGKTIAPSGKGQYVTNGTFDNDVAGWTDKSSGTNAKILWDTQSMLDLIGVTGGTGYAEQSITLPLANVEYTLEFEVKSGPITVRIGTATGGAQILADVSYDKGVQTIKFTPGQTTVFLGFLHTANAARSVDNVSVYRQESITLTANFDIFQPAHVGAFFRIRHGAYMGYVLVTAVTGLRTATATVMDPLASTAATHTWREGAWSDWQGWPTAVVFHQQRLTFACTTKSPQTFWASKSGKYADFTPGTDADDPVNVTVSSNQVNAINWLVSQKSLAVGSVGSEWRIGSADGSDSVMNPSNATAVQETAYGSHQTLPPVRAGYAILFAQRGGRKIRELTYSFQVNGWVAPDLSLLAEHITVGGIVDLAYAQEPDSIVWMVRGDGVLLGLTYNRSEEVVGWHWHDTDGAFENVASIHNGEQDQVWAVVKRTIGGATKRYIEYFTPTFVDQAREDAVFLDCSLSWAGAGATAFSGLGQLEGKTVNILADGSVRSPKTVATGAVSIDKPALKAAIGLPYTSEIQTLRVEAGGEDGTAQSHIKRIAQVTLRVHRSLGYEVGQAGGQHVRPAHRTTSTPLGQAPDLFTGDERIHIDGKYDMDGCITVRQTQPYPLTVLAVICQIGVNG